MTFSQRLLARIESCGNPICFGIDPVLSKIPFEASSPEAQIEKFYMQILESMDKHGVLPAAVKPNSAYFECISVPAMLTLQKLIKACTDLGILVVLDAKRGDIGKSSTAYAQAAFDVYGADCITASAYMGSDSLKPFLNYREGAGVYALLRTSNPGAADLQDTITAENTPFYQTVATKLMEWDNGSLGAVVGATNPGEMEKITRFFVSQNHEIPFLIPGVSVPGVSGQQGGTCADVIKALNAGGSKQKFHLLNSSSGLSYAYEAHPQLSFGEASVKALEALSNDCLHA